MKNNIKVFDNEIPKNIADEIYDKCYHSLYELGWQDTAHPDKNDPNLYSLWSVDDIIRVGISSYIEKCIEETDWFEGTVLHKCIVNAIRSNDVHYIHHHPSEQVVLYYVNPDWIDGWHGETLFYNSKDPSKIDFTSVYKPERLILFDGDIPHTIRPQSTKAPKYRFSISFFFGNKNLVTDN